MLSHQDQSLIDASDSVLIVIDAQPAFLDKLIPTQAERLLTKLCWLIEVSQWLALPLIVTAEDHAVQPVAARVTRLLDQQALPIFDKSTFGVAGQANIRAAIAATQRKTAVLVGLETDVCVLHSALGLQALGYRVAVVTDATGSPADCHAQGLARLQAAGVTLVSAKSLFYEWLRTLDAVVQFHNDLPHMRAAFGEAL